MLEPEPFDDPGPLELRPPSRARRVATVTIIALLIVSTVFLAYVSGRGIVTVVPVVIETPNPSLPIAAGTERPAGGASGRLAVVGADGRLTTTVAGGGSAVALGGPADRGIAFSFPAWSPGGDRIAVIGQRLGGGLVDVFGVTPNGTATADPVTVYDSPDRPPFYLYWSPDGTQVTFLTHEPDGIALRLAPTDGSATADIVRRGSPMYWAWADTDRLLVHSGNDAPDAFIGEVGVDGVAVEPDELGSGGFRAPAVTSDGAFRAYVAPGTTTSERVVVETRQRSDRHVVDVHGAAALDFGPTGSDLAFIAPDAAGREVPLPVGPLRVVSASSGKVRVLLTGSVVAFFWAPNGRTIAALQIPRPDGDGVTEAGLNGRAILARARPAAAASGLTLQLVFVDALSGAIRHQRSVELADVFSAQVLPFFDQYALSHRIWSPDSRAIALPLADDDGTSRIVVIPADGSDTTVVSDGVAAFWSP